MEPEVSQRVAVEYLEGDSLVGGQIGEDVHVLELVDPMRDELLGGALRVCGADQRVSRRTASIVGRLQEFTGERPQSAPEGCDEGPAIRSVAREGLSRIEATDVEYEELHCLALVEVVVALVGRDLPGRDALEKRERLRAHDRGIGSSRRDDTVVTFRSAFRRGRDARPCRDQTPLRHLEFVSDPRIPIREF